MQIIETCPKCGYYLLETTLTVLPPIQRKECPHCGWSWQEKTEEVIRVHVGGYAQLDFEKLGLAESDKIDSVPIIRCKNCKFGLPSTHKGYLLCNGFVNSNYVVPEGYCSEAETKE